MRNRLLSSAASECTTLVFNREIFVNYAVVRVRPGDKATRSHLFPFRTQKWNVLAATILGGWLPGKIARCQGIPWTKCVWSTPLLQAPFAFLEYVELFFDSQWPGLAAERGLYSSEINLADYQSVLVWCKTFRVNFGSAKLTIMWCDKAYRLKSLTSDW